MGKLLRGPLPATGGGVTINSPATGRPEVTRMLHDLTHGGRWQVQYRVGEQAIEPKVPVGMQLALLEFGNEIRQKCVTQLREMMNDESTMKKPGDKP